MEPSVRVQALPIYPQDWVILITSQLLTGPKLISKSITLHHSQANEPPLRAGFQA